MSQVNATSFKDASGGSNAVLYGVAAPANSMGFRNRIINGDMRIAQRGTAAVSTDGSFPVDRWYAFSQAGAFTAQQVTDVPAGAGFMNSILWSPGNTTARTYSGFEQRIEGFNVSDLDWGSASAKAVTISFWVKAGVTATLSVTAANSASTRNYPATYTVNTANTWEFKTITIPGDTSGTWLKDNGSGLRLWFTAGGTSQQTGNAWGSGGASVCATGTTALYAAPSNFWITGVQLEAGTVASPFERRDYGRELMMCQRYYEKLSMRIYGVWTNASDARFYPYFKTTKRSAPVMVLLTTTPSAEQISVAGVTGSGSTISYYGGGLDGSDFIVGGFSGRAYGQFAFIAENSVAASSEL